MAEEAGQLKGLSPSIILNGIRRGIAGARLFRGGRHQLFALGRNPGKVHMETRSRKGCWRMSQNEIVRYALNNRWLEEQGVPDMRAIWIVLHYGPDARV